MGAFASNAFSIFAFSQNAFAFASSSAEVSHFVPILKSVCIRGQLDAGIGTVGVIFNGVNFEKQAERCVSVNSILENSACISGEKTIDFTLEGDVGRGVRVQGEIIKSVAI